MTEIKKRKLIYSGELLIVSLVFLVIGILELLKVIQLSERFQLIFKIVTMVGATWMVADFIWALLSEKHRKYGPIIDKAMLLPLAVYLYAYDIAGFVYHRPYEYYQIGVPIAFLYIACAYIFQAIYHYYNPIQFYIEATEEEIKEEEAEKVEEQPLEEKVEEKEEKSE